MPSSDHGAVAEFVYRQLANPAFRQRLTARVADGTRPILIALLEDPLHRLLRQLAEAGGAANVALSLNNGVVVVFTMKEEHHQAGDPAWSGEMGTLVTSQCTVGVFFARLHLDGGEASYCFLIEGTEDRRDTGRAEVVAIAG